MQTEQRKMLRMMLGIRRRVEEGGNTDTDTSEGEAEEPAEEDIDAIGEGPILEDWISWIKRTTNIAEDLLQKAHVTDWVREQRKRYWDFAGRVAKCSDSRWSHTILHWIPQGGFRHVGSPRKRWSDDIATFCLHELGEDLVCDWFTLAQDTATWNGLRDQFVDNLLL